MLVKVMAVVCEITIRLETTDAGKAEYVCERRMI
jgi:hypothetical protein